MVIAADQSLTFLNKWQCQEGMCKIVETLARLGPPKVTEDTQPDLTTALQVTVPRVSYQCHGTGESISVRRKINFCNKVGRNMKYLYYHWDK